MLPAASRLSITELVHQFQATRSLPALGLLAVSIVRQRRAVELLYGGYCSVFHRPSPVHLPADPRAIGCILGQQAEFDQHGVLYREQLLREYSVDWSGVCKLPTSFAAARRESILEEDGRLILGEYGEGARVACIGAGPA